MSGSFAAVVVAEVLLPVPRHPVAREAVAGREERVRRRVLAAWSSSGRCSSCTANGVPCVAPAPRDDRREAAADAVAADADPSPRRSRARRRSAITQFAAVQAVLERGRDTDARARAGSRPRSTTHGVAPGERARDPVVRLDAADDPAAAVEVDERPARLARSRPAGRSGPAPRRRRDPRPSAPRRPARTAPCSVSS